MDRQVDDMAGGGREKGRIGYVACHLRGCHSSTLYAPRGGSRILVDRSRARWLFGLQHAALGRKRRTS